MVKDGTFELGVTCFAIARIMLMSVSPSWQNINGDVYNGTFRYEKRHGYGGRF